MPLRELPDRRGNVMRVWDTMPTSTRLRPEFEQGWLTFELGETRRRIAPIPTDWDSLDDETLRTLWLSAEPAPRARRLID